MQLQSKVCPQCTYQVPADAVACVRCGHSFGSPVQDRAPLPEIDYSVPYPSAPSAQIDYSVPHGQATAEEVDYTVPYPHALPKPGASGLAIASLVLGILAILSVCVWFVSGPLALLAVIFGIIALKNEGRGLAIAGLVCAAIALVLDVLVFGFFVWAMTSSSAMQ